MLQTIFPSPTEWHSHNFPIHINQNLDRQNRTIRPKKSDYQPTKHLNGCSLTMFTLKIIIGFRTSPN